MNKNINKFHLS